MKKVKQHLIIPEVEGTRARVQKSIKRFSLNRNEMLVGQVTEQDDERIIILVDYAQCPELRYQRLVILLEDIIIREIK